MPAVVGREAELASIRDFVGGIPDGACALALEGEAGMGKTTLFEEGVDAARERDLLVLQARPAESETTLSFCALGDLLDGVLGEVLAPLPSAQRRALSRALVLVEDEGRPPDPHAVGVAVLNGVRALAAVRPVLLAVDDVQWLDAASAAALGYAGRRLREERVGVLLSRRVPLESALLGELRRSLPADRIREMEVGPVTLAALHGVVRGHLDVTLPRPLLAEVHQAAGGNPFFALEIVRTLRRGGVSVEAGQPLPVPESLHDLIHARLLALPLESREYLLAAAAHAHPLITVVERASGVDRQAGLSPALEAGIVELDSSRIRFTHPLLAAGAYEIADPVRRAEVHARLAQLLTDPEARAWQLAASVDEPNAAVAAALEEAALHARSRGAPRPAALLLDRACELTPADRRDDALRRAVDAAFLHYESGDSPRAESQLQGVIARLAPGSHRARATMRLARVRSYEAQVEAVELFLQAVDEAEGDLEILAVAHEGVATCLYRLWERVEESVEHADIAARLALELGNEELAAEALGTKWISESALGRDEAAATADRAMALQPAAENLRVLAQPRFSAAVHSMWTDEFVVARDGFCEALARSRALGDESSPPTVLAQLAEIDVELGSLDGALTWALSGQELSEQSGQHTLFAHHVALESFALAGLGRQEDARAAAARALELIPATGCRHGELIARRALGHLELALGNPAAAVAALEPSVERVRREAIVEPRVLPLADFVEALIELGRTDEAVDVLGWYEKNAHRRERATALASCARCRGLLAAHEGSVDDAVGAYEKALERHAQAELPLDRARTLLALGATQRRAKRRREARATLEEALAVFEGIGAELWAERARDELKRISGRAATPGVLTPAEERVAALVAEGRTNREVAAALYLSDRTVEGHLGRVFAKLGVKKRSEVAPALVSLQTQGIAASNTGDSPVSAGPSAP